MSQGAKAVPTEETRRGLSARQREASLLFLKALSQAAKEVALYRASHPIAITALSAVHERLDELLAATQAPQATVALAQDRWLVDGAGVAAAGQLPEILKALYVNHGIARLTFLRGVKLYELAALGELAGLSPRDASEGFLAEYLLQRGVRNITPGDVTLAAAPEGRAPEPSPSRERGGFSELLRGLIEGAIKDPAERAHVYGDALRLIKEGLDRQVADSTKTLRQERDRVLLEQGRAERVLGVAAEGKVIVDHDGNVLMMNPAAEHIAGKRLVEIAGKPLAEAVKPDEQMLTLSADLALRPGQPLSERVRLLAEAEVERAIKRSVAIIHDEAGRVVGSYASLPDAVKFKEAQRLQEEFVSRITHELKAPLTSISAALELVIEKLQGRLSAEESEYLAIGVRNSKRLHEMISEVLDFAKLESGGLSVKLAPCELAPLLAEAIEGLGPWAKKRSVALTLEPVDPAFPRVLADGARVLQIVTNLLSNAIKSTPSGGSVVVSARRGESDRFWSAVVTVRDTGGGIAPQDLEKVFEKFVQLEGPEGRKDGIGLGLAIVKELVRSHGGAVWAESQLGRGAAFHFTLPLADASGAEEGLCKTSS